MRRTRLSRTVRTDAVTFGHFSENNQEICKTIELPWKENQENISCIPLGIYRFIRFISPHFGEVFKAINVPNRKNIEIHPANFTSDIRGCIGVGKTVGHIDGRVAVLSSKTAFKEFMERFKSEKEIEVEIINESPCI